MYKKQIILALTAGLTALSIISCLDYKKLLTSYIPTHTYNDDYKDYFTKTEIIRQDEEADITQPSQLYSMYACLVDADSGRILFNKNATTKAAMASTTKIMTLEIVLENADLEEYVTASANAAAQPKVRLGMKSGEKYKVKDLLYALMLESYNDTAVALAEHVAGSVEAFCEMMTSKACSLGCTNTLFLTPNGLDKSIPGTKEEFHSTTAYELARILSYCIKESEYADKFLEITRTKSYSFSDKDNKRHFTVNNKNAFLNMMEGALTGKTGFTGKAGYCYTGALESNGRTFVVALLACGWPNNKSYKWSDTRKLMNFGLDNFQTYNFDKIPLENITSREVKVINTAGKGLTNISSMLFQISDCTLDKILVNKADSISVKYQIPRVLSAPIYSGDSIGKIEYQVNDQKWSERDIIATEDLLSPDFSWYIKGIISLFL